MTLDLFSPLEPKPGARAVPAVRPPAVEPAAGGRAYSVSLLNSLVRELLEGACPPVWVTGEVSGWKRHPSGHCYFSLRDAEAQVRCVMFRSDAQRLPTDPRDGGQVRALATVTLYERRGEFQLVVHELEGMAEGGLWRLAFERLHARLAAEGLLAPERKRPLPPHPAAVGVVTSPAGAALHDILHVIGRRAPWTRVVLSPARVQGDGAAQEIARAVERFGQDRCVDVVIVGRGGGSAEDLWAFNHEDVARALAACDVPVISAVGHETDLTIADLVADHRAPTPSAAAEAAVPDGTALEREIADARERIGRAATRRVETLRWETASAPEALEGAAGGILRARRERMALLAGKLDALSPLSALRRGFAVPLAEDGRVLRRAADFRPGLPALLRIVDATVGVRVEEVRPDATGEG